MDDERSEVIIEDQTEGLQEVIQLTVITLIALRWWGRSKELGVKLMLVLADVEEEGAAGPEEPGVVSGRKPVMFQCSQCTCVQLPGVHGDQLGHGAPHTPAQQLQPAVEVVPLDVRQQAVILRQILIPAPSLHLLNQ